VAGASRAARGVGGGKNRSGGEDPTATRSPVRRKQGQGSAARRGKGRGAPAEGMWGQGEAKVGGWRAKGGAEPPAAGKTAAKIRQRNCQVSTPVGGRRS